MPAGKKMPVKHTICAILFWGWYACGLPLRFIHASPPGYSRAPLSRVASTSTEVAFANAELQYQGFRA